MKTLSQVLRDNYKDCLCCSNAHYNDSHIGKTTFMTIPLTGDCIEVPVFAAFTMYCTIGLDAIVAIIRYNGQNGVYKSVGNNIRYAMSSPYPFYNLAKVASEGEEIYYATYGAIFNKDFLPVMLLSWEFEKVYSDDEQCPYKYKATKPLLRLSPDVFRKSNAVEKHIVNKILPEILTLENMEFPRERGYSFKHHPYGDVVPNITTIIGDFPFSVTTTDIPSVSTTNKDLLSIALDNLDELML